MLQILDYIGERNPWAAERLADRIEQATSQLPLHPYLYKQSERVSGARELVVHPNYIVFYRVEVVIEILAVVHAHRNFP
ncbi:MAG: type II toxin-antitoxin system RelE/ParE family toxin [Rudaea sp.]|uniref:type II toxin-antitoxin system RelE/ParE family toxin n=1 Tax=Rudaea sp. TaxID=2136325 RepID=UPI0039E369D7